MPASFQLRSIVECLCGNEHSQLISTASAFFGVRPERNKRPLQWEGHSAPHPPTMQSWLRAVWLESRSALRNKRPLYARRRCEINVPFTRRPFQPATQHCMDGGGGGLWRGRLKFMEGTLISLGTGRDPVVFYPGIHGLGFFGTRFEHLVSRV